MKWVNDILRPNILLWNLVSALIICNLRHEFVVESFMEKKQQSRTFLVRPKHKTNNKKTSSKNM